MRDAFDRKVLGMSADARARYWLRYRIQGKGHPPRAIGSARVLQRIVSRHREAIAFVRLSDVAAGVKVLAIDGRRPGAGGYPLEISAPAAPR